MLKIFLPLSLTRATFLATWPLSVEVQKNGKAELQLTHHLLLTNQLPVAKPQWQPGTQSTMLQSLTGFCKLMVHHVLIHFAKGCTPEQRRC